MDELIKFLHLLSLVLGAGGGIGNLYLGFATKSAEAPPPPWVMKLRLAFARTGLVGVSLIWLTGLYLLITNFGGWVPGLAFSLKMLTALLLLLGVIAINVLLHRIRRTGVPMPIVPKLGMTTTLLTGFAVLFAVLAFG